MYGNRGIFRPIAKTHTDALKQRVYTLSHITLVLILYELFIGVGRFTHPNFPDYIPEELWYQLFHNILPASTLIISLSIIFYYSYYLICDWYGIRTFKEQSDHEKKQRQDEAAGKFPDYRPKRSFKSMFKWYFFTIFIIEGFILGSLIYSLLPWISYIITLLLTQQIDVPIPETSYSSIRKFHTDIFIRLGLAFGAGFYEESIFRLLLINFLSQLHNYTKPLPIPTTKPLTKPIIVIIASLIYAVSHYILPSGEPFLVYTFIYRFVFGIILYQIMKRLQFQAAIWTHIFHDIWYYILV